MDAALTEYADMKDRMCERRRISPDWKFTIRDLQDLGKQFGLAGTPPPPTAEQKAADAERERQQRETRKEEIRKQQEREAQWEADWNLKPRKKKLLNEVVCGAFTLDHLDLSDGMPAQYFTIRARRDDFRGYAQELISRPMDKGLTDEEIREELMVCMSMIWIWTIAFFVFAGASGMAGSKAQRPPTQSGRLISTPVLRRC
jgi:hypothetical protein